MRVVIPDKSKEKISEALTELYLLRQAIESGILKDTKKLIKRVDKIRHILQD
tara:strand:- start:450 stop:605 length:156 start_codon:yes stop_codon:yes gene_type:complete